MLGTIELAHIDWAKGNGLLPAIVQDETTRTVLMLGYMSRETLDQTLKSGHVTFFSRSKQRPWMKGETTGNILAVRDIKADCDGDALLIIAEPRGPACHTGTQTCFGNSAEGISFLKRLERLIAEREIERPEGSYTGSLFDGGVPRIAQKVTEEAVETALAAAMEPNRLSEEAADLIFHLLVLLRATGKDLDDVIQVLQERFEEKSKSQTADATTAPSDLAEAIALLRQGERPRAEKLLTRFIERKFPLFVDHTSIAIRQDATSLNSINGTFTDVRRNKYFFKFHSEESESDTMSEYYRGELLAKHGYPVELPVFASHEVGEQFLIYRQVDYERLFDVCQRIEKSAKSDFASIVSAQSAFDRLIADKCLSSLRKARREDYLNEPILQLFFWRLVDKISERNFTPGGRYRRFYVDQEFVFPDGLKLSYAELSRLKWNINGVRYETTLEEAFDRARDLLSPSSIADYVACTAHGDDHNGNVWVKPARANGITFSLFDPAFAGENVPVLLAQVKATFHNVLAHPLWLYDANAADGALNVSAEVHEDTLFVRHDWALTALREKFLCSKKNFFWIPVLRELKRRQWLAPDWQDYVRAALFCCPTLVMNLRAGAGNVPNIHTPKTSLLGFSIAMMCASAPLDGTDPIDAFFGEITNALHSEPAP